MADDLLIVTDEDLGTRIATELKGRGRRARTAAELGLRGTEDPDFLTELSRLQEDLVLLTGDDRMPLVHAAAIATLGSTIATIDPRRAPGITLDHHRREVAHRWAHRIARQPTGTVRRYSQTSSRDWTRRVR